MKLFRFGKKGEEKPGVLIEGVHYDVSASGIDYDFRFLENGGINHLKYFVSENIGTLPIVEENERMGVPFNSPRKIVCVGLNFEDHVKETQLQQASEPIIFLKAISALNGPFDGVTLPKNSKKTDWETELAIVIGKKAVHVEEHEVEDYILGYVLHNDLSEREFQTERGGTWDKGKGCDTFAPVGPYIVTPDEIENINNLNIWLKLNGEYMQNGSTKDFIYKIPKLISYISQFMSLQPGDIVSTGSPAGAGMGRNPQVFLKDGDVIEYGIEGLGSARQEIKAYKVL